MKKILVSEWFEDYNFYGEYSPRRVRYGLGMSLIIRLFGRGAWYWRVFYRKYAWM